MPELLNPAEMHLKAVLEMREARIPPRRARISRRLGQAGPTVTKTVLRMERDGLLAFSEESKVLDLTRDGLRRAIAVLRKHRLAETFLDETVGFDPLLLHAEASRWEHVIGDDAVDRIDRRLGRPSRSPFGNPIPSDGQEHWDPLAETPTATDLVGVLVAADGVDRSGILEWVGEPAQDDPGLLARLLSAGVVPGARIVCGVRGAKILVRARGQSDGVEIAPSVAAELVVRP